MLDFNTGRNRMITMVVDGKEYNVEKDISLLKALRTSGVSIPSLCYHPALKKPIGACRLCVVEVCQPGGAAKTVLSCAVKTSDGLQIKTATDAVCAARKKAILQLLALAPQSEILLKLASDSGIEIPFQPDGCIRCRLCERVCSDIVGAAALKMEKRDGRNYIVPVEGACIGCGTCANICPTKVIQIEDKESVRTIRIRNEIIGVHPLEQCAICGKRFATPRFLAYIHQRTLPHPDVKDHHHYCPSCAKLYLVKS